MSEYKKLYKVITDKGLYKLILVDKKTIERCLLEDDVQVIEVSEVTEEDMA